MTIDIKLDGNTIDLKTFQFSGGEVHVELKGLYDHAKKVNVIARIQEPADIMQLILVKEVLDRHTIGARHLTVPYFPYGRQDRVTSRGTAFSLKSFCWIVNSLSFNSVDIFDPHSDVTTALLGNSTVVSQLALVQQNPGLCDYIKKNVTALIAPDSGAYKKASHIATHFQLPLFTATKIRDTSTGEITGTRILDDVSGHNLLIVDDICDGGRTFVELAKELRLQGSSSIALYVTHGIFSKGYAPFKGLIDRIYTTNTFLPKSLPLYDEVTLFVHRIIT